MRGGRDARQTQPVVQDEGPRASGSGSGAAQSPVAGPSSSRHVQPTDAQPVDADEQPTETTGTPNESNSEVYHDVLVGCNSLVEQYRKGEILKPTVYVEIQSKLAEALGGDRARSDTAFGSFIATIKSHDTEIGAAAGKGRAIIPVQHSPSAPLSISNGHQSDEEPVAKKVKVDESAYAWVSGRRDKRAVLRDSLSKTLKLIEVYTVDPKATKRSLVNEPDCPEFPDSEWKNIIAGRAVNLDAVLSGQLSTTHDDPKVKKFGELEITFGAVEPTKLVKNGGDWTIAWNRTVRATVYGFGGSGSCHDYTAFIGLVLWIAIFIKLLVDLFGYIDDNFGFDEEGNVIWYGPYQCYYPAKQTKLLLLWDEIGLPHEKSKQEYAPVLRIIGFMVDPEIMHVSMDEEDRARLIQQVSEFTATAPGGTRRTL